MSTVKEVSRIAGVTPRTLRYYDKIGLLKPSRIADNGYRYYDDRALQRLQLVEERLSFVWQGVYVGLDFFVHRFSLRPW